MDTLSNTKKNPSRETCQKIIKRILITEVLEKGTNEHFRHASDFMAYFQSLYPASDALTKQVQRAIKAMNMPRDEHGYFIVNKTSEQLEQDQEIGRLLQKGEASLLPLEGSEPVLLMVPPEMCDYLIHTLKDCISLQNHYDTIFKTSNGIIIYTREKARILSYLQPLLSTN
ncbi:MAG: hypothetical protein K2N01_08765 [Lachnospiraceae bacterium]|nr:hypothetical protein [Lachnospiraceae bacterium]